MPDSSEFPKVTDRVTQDRINVYAELSGDYNPLHVDLAVAARSEFGGTIAHGPIALHSFLRAATEWLGTEALPSGSEVKVTYRAPTRPGDDITCVLTREELVEDRQSVEAECVNQDGTTVVSIKSQFPAN